MENKGAYNSYLILWSGGYPDNLVCFQCKNILLKSDKSLCKSLKSLFILLIFSLVSCLICLK